MLDVLDNWFERSIDPLVLASLVLVPGIKHSVEADFCGAEAQDPRILDLLRMQLRAAVGRRGLTRSEQVDVIPTTGPGLFAKWAKKHILCTKPHASRWVPVTRGNGACKAALLDIDDRPYGLRVQVKDAFVTVYNAWGLGIVGTVPRQGPSSVSSPRILVRPFYKLEYRSSSFS